MTRRFELVEGSSNKFWEISLDQTTVIVRYGKIGSDGRQTVKTAETELEATQMVDKLVAEKTRKGYVEVGAAATPQLDKGVAKPRTKAARPKSVRGVADAAPKFRAKVPFGFAAVFADINHGVLAVPDGDSVHVFEPAKERREVSLGWRSERYLEETVPADISGLKVVLHEGPCLAVSWRNCRSSSPNDGPGIGLFRLDGSPIAIRYFHDAKTRSAPPKDDYVNDETELLAASLEGDKLAWLQGYSLRAISVADFVAGRDAEVWEDVSPRWAAIDERGVVYANKGVEGFIFEANKKPKPYTDYADRLYAFHQGLLSENLLITGGKARTIDSEAWMVAVDGEAGAFTLTSAAGTGDVICVGPGSYKKPHLVFVQLSTGKVLSVKKHPGKVFTIHLVGDTLYALGERQMTSLPWPEDGQV